VLARGQAIVNPVDRFRARVRGSEDNRSFDERSRTMSAGDDIKNTAEKLTGKAKEGFGKLTDNERLEAEGKADQVKASAKQAGENVKDAAQKTGENVRDAFEK
jgi:uncharacterized protein YjbJ (UPF0337 family)